MIKVSSAQITAVRIGDEWIDVRERSVQIDHIRIGERTVGGPEPAPVVGISFVTTDGKVITAPMATVTAVESTSAQRPSRDW